MPQPSALSSKSTQLENPPNEEACSCLTTMPCLVSCYRRYLQLLVSHNPEGTLPPDAWTTCTASAISASSPSPTATGVSELAVKPAPGSRGLRGGERTDGVSFLNEKFWHWPLSRAFPCFHLVLGPGTHTRENGKRKLCRRAKPLEKQECLPALPLSPRRPEHSAQGTLSCCVEEMGEPCSSDLALSWGKKYLKVCILWSRKSHVWSQHCVL